MHFSFCADLYPTRELFNLITENVHQLIEWNTIMKDFMGSPRKEPHLQIKL